MSDSALTNVKPIKNAHFSLSEKMINSFSLDIALFMNTPSTLVKEMVTLSGHATSKKTCQRSIGQELTCFCTKNLRGLAKTNPTAPKDCINNGLVVRIRNSAQLHAQGIKLAECSLLEKNCLTEEFVFFTK